MQRKYLKDPNEFDIHYKSYQHMTGLIDKKIIFTYLNNDISTNRLKEYLCRTDQKEISRQFEDWDARYCEYTIEVPGEKPVSGKYIFNTEGKYGYDTKTYFMKLVSNELTDIDEVLESRPRFPKNYSDFKNFKIWAYLNCVFNEEPFNSAPLLFYEKISLTRPVEIPCYVTHCLIDGIIDVLIIRNKNYTLAEALEVLANHEDVSSLKWDCGTEQLPPSYQEVCRNGNL